MPDQYDITAYVPTLEELDPARIQALRAVGANLVSQVQPDVDTRPNTPFGDLFLSPAAVGMAADEIMWSRFMSDLNPENAEAGTVFNCAFIEKFFLNFGIHDDTGVEAAGMLRLQFNSGARREIDAGTVFKLGESYYRPLLPAAGPAVLLARGVTPLNTDTNILRYTMYDLDSWVVDILVSGLSATAVEEGASAAVDREIAGLTGTSTLAGFDTGAPPDRIQELARRIRTNFNSRTPTTRGGAVNMIRRRFPSFEQVSAVLSGDFEMCRDSINQAGVTAGRLDILVRAKRLVEDTAVVRLLLTEGRLRGWVDLPETPTLVLGLGDGETYYGHTLYSTTEDSMKPGLSASYGASERLFVDMAMPLGEGGEQLLDTVAENVGETVETVSYLTVSYLFDPELAAARRFAETEECEAAGIDIYVKGFVPVVVSDLAVHYYRAAGVTLNLTQARQEIVDGFNGHTLVKPAGAHTVTDAMAYAGAHSVKSIVITAEVRMSVADKVYTGGAAPDPIADWASFDAACETVPTKAVTSVYEPDLTIADDGETPLYAAAGERNTSWLLPAEALRLIELRSV